MPFHQGLKKGLDTFVTNREDARALKGLKKREAARQARLNAAPEPIAQTNPRNVKLPQVGPNPGPAVLAGENPPVTGRGGINQIQAGQTVTVQPDRSPLRTPVEITRGGIGPDAGTTSTIHSDSRGGTISDPDLKTQNLARAKAAAFKGAQDVLAKPAAFSTAQVKAAGELISSGAAAESIGGVVGRNIEGASRGLNQALGDVAAVEAEAPLRPAPVSDDVVLRNAQSTVVPDEALVKPQQLGVEQPKAQRSTLGKAKDAVLGVGAAAKKKAIEIKNTVIKPPPAGETPVQKDGRIKSATKSAFRVGGALAVLDIANMLIEPIAEKGFGQASADIANGLGDIVKNLPENTRNYLAENSSGDIFQDLKDVGVDLIKSLVDSPAAFGNSVAVLLEQLESGNLGDFKSGVLFAPGEQSPEAQAAGLRTAEFNGNNFDVVRGASSFFGDEQTTAPDPVQEDPQQGQQLIDQSRAGDNRGLRTATVPTNNIAPPGNESFFINNNNTTPEHAGEAPGQKQFFHDIPQAFPQSQQGLRGAREELSSRNQFRDNNLNSFAKLGGAFARSRQASDRAAFDQDERKNFATLGAATGTAQSVSNDKRLDREQDLADTIYQGFGSENAGERSAAELRATAELTKAVNNRTYDPNNQALVAAQAMVSQQIFNAANVGIFEGLWNVLPLTNGRNVFNFLQGDPLVNTQNIGASLALNSKNQIIVKSTDKDGQINIDGDLPPAVLSFLRRTVKNRVD